MKIKKLDGSGTNSQDFGGEHDRDNQQVAEHHPWCMLRILYKKVMMSEI